MAGDIIAILRHAKIVHAQVVHTAVSASHTTSHFQEMRKNSATKTKDIGDSSAAPKLSSKRSASMYLTILYIDYIFENDC